MAEMPISRNRKDHVVNEQNNASADWGILSGDYLVIPTGVRQAARRNPPIKYGLRLVVTLIGGAPLVFYE